jgi:ribosomal peptide maturation radical SAM protein 1
MSKDYVSKLLKCFQPPESGMDVLLINMPFTNSFSPSIGLGLLKTTTKQNGISTRCLDFHLLLSAMVGNDRYQLIEGKTYPEHLAGEWLFSSALNDQTSAPNFEQYFNTILCTPDVDVPEQFLYKPELLEQIREAMVSLQGKVHEFLELCAGIVESHKPKLVAFTSMFQQHVASLALAKLISQRSPECVIVFGGSNCEGPMGAETFRQFPFIDILVSGEGERVFPSIVNSVLSSQKILPMTGVLTRQQKQLPLVNPTASNTPLIEDLDTLPIPDYDDFFEQLRSSSISNQRRPALLFETSRGCWWGEKQHCTFCGLNGATMTYRSKSPERAMAELLYLTDRYSGCKVNAVDNILDMKYFRTFIKQLAENRYDFGLFYEVKANLKKEHLKLLKAAGIHTLQPGIESLSDNVLKIMKKGVSALQNIQLLKWCRELDVRPVYNIIWGFPGENSDDYYQTINLIPSITHLTPPVGLGTIRIDRFSPNFTKHDELGFGELTPCPAYGFVYPFDNQALSNLAYYFTADYKNVCSTLTPKLSSQIRSWQTSFENSELFYFDKESQLLVWDLRPISKERLVVLDDFERLVYLACDETKTPEQIRDHWRTIHFSGWDKSKVRDVLDSLVERKLTLRDGDQFLSLALHKSIVSDQNTSPSVTQ